jgi:hypothetical protein
MKTYTAIIAPRYDFITLYLTTQLQGIAQLSVDTTSILLKKTSVQYPAFEEVFTSKYTIDTNGSITLSEIFLFVDTDPLTTSNGVSKVEISGDAGHTWAPMSGDVIGSQYFEAYGLWIDKIDSVTDGLQFKYSVASTDGTDAYIYFFNDYEVVITLNKKVV